MMCGSGLDPQVAACAKRAVFNSGFRQGRRTPTADSPSPTNFSCYLPTFGRFLARELADTRPRVKYWAIFPLTLTYQNPAGVSRGPRESGQRKFS